MNKATKIICICFIIVFTAAAILPFAGMIFKREDAAQAEQRDPSPFPAVVSEKGINTKFGEQFESWFADRFAFRSELADLNGRAKLALFNTSSEESVIAGKDGWLFYAETLPDYCREERLNDSQLSRLVTTLRLESDYAKSRGAAYVFAAAPNKNSVYPEMMGGLFSQNSGISLLDRLNAALEAEGIAVCDLKSDLIASKPLGQLYYTGDSHWNLLGSTVVWNSISEKVRSLTGVDLPESGRTLETLSHAAREDDLLKMVRPKDPETFEQYSLDSSEERYTVVGRMSGLDDMFINTECSSGVLRLVMFRDSFGRAMIKPLANSFGEAVFTRNTYYPWARGDETDAKTVVVREIVERNLTKLLETAPAVPAARTGAADLPAGARSIDHDKIKFEACGTLDGLVRYCGTADFDGESSRVFVKINGEYYEAFPFCDTLSELSENAKCGFTFWYPQSETDISIEEVMAG